MLNLDNIKPKLRVDLVELGAVLLIAIIGAVWAMSSQMAEIKVTTDNSHQNIVALAETQAKAARDTNKQLTALSVQTGVLIHRVKQLENDLVEVTYTKEDLSLIHI